MRELNHKKAFGLLGLAGVAAMTTVAAALPTPDAGALSSVSDNIVVHVLSEAPNVSITNIRDKQIFTDPVIQLGYSFGNVDNVTAQIGYTGADGAYTTTTLQFKDFELVTFRLARDGSNYQYDIDTETGLATGTNLYQFNLRNLPNFPGYGWFDITVRGEGAGTQPEDSVSILYSPVNFDAEHTKTEEADGGNPIIDFELDGTENIGRVEITIKKTDGTVINSTPIKCSKAEGGLSACKVPFTDYKLKSGDYDLSVATYDADNNYLYTTVFRYRYTVSQINPNAPQTGSEPQTLNIASEDFLATALVVFGLALVASFALLKKRSRR